VYSQGPWRRGIGSDFNRVFDGQGSVVVDNVGTKDGNLIAAAPDLLNSIIQSDDTHWTPAMRAAIDKARYRWHQK